MISGGDICLLCWEFMTVAMKIIDASLRGNMILQCNRNKRLIGLQQMILDLRILCGFIQVVVVFIVGFAMKERVN
jgi:hypothetical protein